MKIRSVADVVRNAVALMFSTIGSAALGMLFWVVAARLFDVAQVGRASAAVSAITLLGGLAQLSLNSAFIRFLPVTGGATTRFLRLSYTASGSTGVILAAGFFLLGLGENFDLHGPYALVGFCLAVVCSAFNGLQDSVLTALKHTTWVPVENIGVALLKLALLPFLGGAVAVPLLISWGVPMMVAAVTLSILIFGWLAPRHARRLRGRQQLPTRTELVGFVASQNLNGILGTLTVYLPPLLVTIVLGPGQSGLFYVPWLIATALLALSWNVLVSLVVEASTDPTRFREHLRHSLRLLVLVTVGGGGVLAVFAPLILSVLGHEYAAGGATSLRLIGLALPAGMIATLFAAAGLLSKKTLPTFFSQVAGAVLFLGGAYLGLRALGVVGAAVAFFGSEVVLGAVLLPLTVRRLRNLSWAADLAVFNQRVLARGVATVPARGVATVADLGVPRLRPGFDSLPVQVLFVPEAVADWEQLGQVDTVRMERVRDRGGDRVRPGLPAPRQAIPADETTTRIHRVPAADATVTFSRDRSPTDDGGVRVPAQDGVARIDVPDATMQLPRPRGPADAGETAPGSRPLGAPEPVTGYRAGLAWVALVLGLLAVPAAAISELGTPVRFAVLLAFTCCGPGAAFASLIRLGDWVSSWAMAFLLSLALAGATADAMVWMRVWNPVGGYAALAIPTVLTALVVLRPRQDSWRSAAARRPLPAGDRLALSAGERRPLPSGGRLALPSGGRSSAGGRPPGGRSGQAAAGRPALPAGGRPAARSSQDLRSSRTPFDPLLPSAAGFDETVTLPRLRGTDRTAVLPAIGSGRRPDDTLVVRLPAMRPSPAGDVVVEAVTTIIDVDVDVDPTREPWSRARILGLLAEVPLVGVILGLWLFGLSRTSLSTIGDYGLLSRLHPLVFVAVGLSVARFVVELARRRWRGWVLVTQTALLAVLMHATVPLLVYEPEYAWSYKHVGVIELIRSQGRITNSLDLYQQWPTFFATVAHLVDGSGLSSLRVAAWAPVFFDLAFCVPLYAIARTLATDRRVPFLTVFLFTAVDWVAQDYLSPQAFTYILALGAILIMLRWLRRSPTRRGRIPARVARLWAWVDSGLTPMPYPTKSASRAAAAVLYLVYFVIVTSHQLSPYVVAMTACALVVLGLVRPVRIVPILLGIAVLYLLPRYQIADSYGLFDGFNFFSNVQSAGPVQGTTAARTLSAHVVQLLALTVWGLSALAVVTSWRRPGPVAVPAVLAFSPFGLLLAQAYGGEAIYRVYLFSIPWCAYLIATLLLRRRWLPHGIGLPASALVLTAAVLASLQGLHGQLTFNRFTRAEVQASTFLYNNAEPGADIIMAAGNFPTRLTARYDRFKPGPNSDHGLLNGDNDLAELPLVEADLPKINSYVDPDVPTYLVFSPAMRSYLHYFQYMPDGSIDRLRATIVAAPNWHLVYQESDVYIFRYVSGRSGP